MSEIARLIRQLGWTVIGGALTGFFLWLLWAKRGWILDFFNACLGRVHWPFPKRSTVLRIIAKYATLRHLYSLALAYATLLLGAMGWILWLDDGWCDRHHRLWHRKPQDIEEELLRWDQKRRRKKAKLNAVDEWYETQKSRRAKPF